MAPCSWVDVVKCLVCCFVSMISHAGFLNDDSLHCFAAVNWTVELIPPQRWPTVCAALARVRGGRLRWAFCWQLQLEAAWVWPAARSRLCSKCMSFFIAMTANCQVCRVRRVKLLSTRRQNWSDSLRWIRFHRRRSFRSAGLFERRRGRDCMVDGGRRTPARAVPFVRTFYGAF